MEETMDLRYLLKIVKRHSRLVYYAVGIAIVIALAINNFVPPRYESTATLRVKYSGKSTDLVGTLSADDLMRQQIFTYAEIVRSKAVIEAMIEKEFSGADKQPSYEEMVKNIEITPVKNTEILSVSVQAATPEKAQSMTNSLLEAFFERFGEIVRAEGRDARTFLGERLAEAKKDLDRAQKAVVDYKKSKETVSVSSHTTMLLDRQAALIRQAADNQQALAASQAKLGNAKSQISRRNSSIADNPLIQQYKGKLAEQEIELVSLRKTLSANHPRVISLQAAIAETSNKLKKEIAKVVKQESPSSNPVHQTLMQSEVQAEMDLAVARVQNDVIRKQTEEGMKELLALPEKEQGLARLIMDYSVAENNYTLLAKKYEEARISEVTQPMNVQVVDDALLPEKPVKPRRLLNLGVAIILGLFAGISSTFAVEYFNKTLDNVQDLRHHLGLPVLGSIPAYDKPRKRKLSWWQKLFRPVNRTVGGQKNA